jgi:hypothetical protein
MPKQSSSDIAEEVLDVEAGEGSSAALEPLVRAVIHQICVIASEMEGSGEIGGVAQLLATFPVDVIAKRTGLELTFAGSARPGYKRDRRIETIDFDSLFEAVCAAATFARQDSIERGLTPVGRQDLR